MDKKLAYYHLPGLFEFYDLYKVFLNLYFSHSEYFYPWCQIGSIYGAPSGCKWAGGRIEEGDQSIDDILSLVNGNNISARLTFSNSLLTKEHLDDQHCNQICKQFINSKVQNGIIVHSDLLRDYLQDEYPELYLVSSTTKVITDFQQLQDELNQDVYKYVVPDFRFNKSFDKLSSLSDKQKEKVEFLCNECCYIGCKDRKACYENVSKRNLDPDYPEFVCKAPDLENGYRFSKAMKNPSFISIDDIQNVYLPMGFKHFKIEGRGLGNALILEFLLYYLTKPEYQLIVREEIYLDNMLDLF